MSAAAFRDGARFWVQRVLVPGVVGVGVVGNLVTAVVLTRPRMRSSTNVYLTALAASDLLYLVFMFTVSLDHYPFTKTHQRYWHYRPYGLWLTDAFSSTSIWLTVSFTVERYIAVCHPLRRAALCTEARARAVCLAAALACLAATAPTPLEWQVGENEEGFLLVESALGRDEDYRLAYYWFSGVAFVFLPLLLLAIFNTFLVLAVHRSQRQRCRLTQVDQHESSQSQENRITITLIAVVVLFLVCQIPTAVVLAYTALHPPADADEDAVLRGLGNVCNLLMALHSACNFVLYCALSDKYRRTFVRTFLPWCYRRAGSSSMRLTAFSSSRHRACTSTTDLNGVEMQTLRDLRRPMRLSEEQVKT